MIERIDPRILARDTTKDTLEVSFKKINDNFQELDGRSSGSGIPDAPNDANAYVRSGLAWVFGYTKSAIDTLLGNKVDKVIDKQLSTEDYTTTEKSKLSGIASGATANDTDANLKNRANHTGTQTSSTISDFISSVGTLITNALALFKTANYLDFTSSGQTQIDSKVNSSSVVVKSLTSNFVTTSSTNTNTNLNFSIGSNEVWFMAIDLEVNNGSGSTGLRLQISAPTGATVEGSISGFNTTATSILRNRISSVNTQIASINNATGTSEVRGFVRIKNGSTAGTISLGCASTTNGTTTTILAGSTIRANITTEV